MKKLTLNFIKERWEKHIKHVTINPEMYTDFTVIHPFGILCTKFDVSFCYKPKKRSGRLDQLTENDWKEIMSDEKIWEKLDPVIMVLHRISGDWLEYSNVGELVSSDWFGKLFRAGKLYI